MAFFSLALPKILKDEGGFQNDPKDSANYCDGKLIGTNKGISAIGYKGFYGICPTVQQIKQLTSEQAGAIYKKNYWDKINGDNIENFSVAQLMMQYIIGSGASQISDIKNIANKTNGKDVLILNDLPITDKEIQFINSLNQQVFWNALKNWRLEFYKRLKDSNPAKYGEWYNGWVKRLGSYVFVDEKKKVTDWVIIILIALILSWILIKIFPTLNKIIAFLISGLIIYFAYNKLNIKYKIQNLLP